MKPIITSIIRVIYLSAFVCFLSGCEVSQLNNPYTTTDNELAILYTAFSQRPKHLDPAVAYSSNEYEIIAQIYEPPLQYHYLKRPYQLEPLTATKMPTVRYFNKHNQELKGDFLETQVAYTDYLIEIKADIYYQPHPAFDTKNHALDAQQLTTIQQIQDFASQPSRPLQAADYVYQIKRLAHPKIQSPIAQIMKNYIVGFEEFSKTVADMDRHLINAIPMRGVEVLSRYQYKIRIKGKYPQFIYWLAMPFFAPMAWEADVFYQQQGLKDKNITLDWFPLGTGAYFLTENNPNRRMILTKNPHYHLANYPTQGEVGDRSQGLLKDAGKQLPFIDQVVFTLEKETIPYWHKFLQGYYDYSGISSDSFDQAVQFSGEGNAQLTSTMKAKDIQLQTSVMTSISYMGFNMLDTVVGGDSERARKLRLAISIALDYEEYIAIFMNGRGVAAQGLLPPGIFGFIGKQQGINPYVYDWANGKYQRKPLKIAQQMMIEAGYKAGIDPNTGKALILYFDTTSINADGRARMNWYRKQFAKLGIKLVIRATDYNRFQEKIRNGSGQLFVWGWNADYPDPENFFFLLYGDNGKVKHGGENATNYNNPKFNQLFEQMRNMDNSAQRLKIVHQMQAIVRHDAPWIFGFYPKSFTLLHSWYKNTKPNLMANNSLKYKRIDTQSRAQKRQQWNKAVFWPLLVGFFVLLLLVVPVFVAYKRRKQAVIIGQ